MAQDVARTEWPMEGEDLETFLAQDGPTRHLILCMLGAYGPITDAHHDQLAAHPNGRMITTWLLQLPAYRRTYDACMTGENE